MNQVTADGAVEEEEQALVLEGEAVDEVPFNLRNFPYWLDEYCHSHGIFGNFPHKAR